MQTFDVDPKYLDYSFPASDRYVKGYLGPGHSNLMGYSQAVELIPSSDWIKLIQYADASQATLDYMVTRVNDQEREGQCHVADTEVLTEKGWTPWPEYNWTDTLGTMNPVTGNLEYQLPTKRHVYEHRGDILFSTHRSVDFGVTANHRMMVRKWNERARKLDDEYTFQLAGNLGWYAGLPAATRGFIGTEINKLTVEGDRQYDGDDFVSLLAVLAADGFASRVNADSHRVSFCCFDPARYRIVSELADRTGFTEQPGRRGVWYRYRDSAALGHWLRSNLYTSSELGAQNKKVPDIVKVSSMRQIRLFLDYFGDKDRNRTDGGCQFFSSSKRLMDDLQELHLKIGIRSSVGEPRIRPTSRFNNGKESRSLPAYVLTVWQPSSGLSITPKKNIERSHYDGLVYCATVPNGTLVTRRNGTVLISGNCVAEASTKSIEIVTACTYGLEQVIPISPASLYHRIGTSESSGAIVMDGIEAMVREGVLPLDTAENRRKFKHTHPAVGFSVPLPDGWQETAKLFKAVTWYAIDSFAAMVTALLRGHPVVVGREGHSIIYLRVRLKNGNLVFIYLNSWGRWGFASGNLPYGFGADSERLGKQACHGAYALVSVTHASEIYGR